ncbi:Uncharacterised protein [Orientia tsutsugamushi]|uniref:Uncharacterized protein n=1 Tax=Orientia tsutsugamushi TaxID=784 RepID=A0A2U3QQG0_ORITS|nr:Uncharacterised protein [Orientia tsutsugamushi]
MQIKKCNTIVNYIELRYEIYYKVKLTMHFMQKSWQYLFIVMCYLVDLAKHDISSIIFCVLLSLIILQNLILYTHHFA